MTNGLDALTPINAPVPSMLSAAYGGSGSLSRDLGALVYSQSQGSRFMHPAYSSPVIESQQGNASYQVDYQPPSGSMDLGGRFSPPSQDPAIQMYEAAGESLKQAKAQGGAPAPSSAPAPSISDSPSGGLADRLDELN